MEPGRMSKVYRVVGKGYAAWVAGVLILFGLAPSALAEGLSAADSASRVQRIVDRLRHSFDIPQHVRVDVVARNPRIASVRRSAEQPDLFLLSIQHDFLALLDDDEVEAMVAHELGHVWIFTHHPYLQTEQLANRIAMRHVTRERLAQVYGKLWGADALNDSLTSFLGMSEGRAASTETVSPR
jgi:hypothetical protein